MKKGISKFYLLRLRNSSLAEIIYRGKQFYFLKKIKGQLTKNKDPIDVPDINTKDVKELQLPSFHGQLNNELVIKILKGYVFSLNVDPEAIKKFTETYRRNFCADIRSTNQHPDIRAAWEPARLQQLVVLQDFISDTAGASEVKQVKQFIKDSVFTWIHQNPFLFGLHYISAMECGLRIPVFFYCLKQLDNLDVADHKLILHTIFRQGWWISKNLSLHSSLGNHAISESVGLIFAGAVYRNTKEGQQWMMTGITLLKQELAHQILADGGPAEQSLNYHRFVLDLYWLAIDFLEKNDLYDCHDFKEHLTQAEHFLSAFEYAHGRLLSIGDSDDGHAIAPGLYPRRIFPDNKKLKIQTFLTSGYTIINDNDAVLTFDHGPLGMAPLYNHGHADALSITLSVGNNEMLVDPGTYRYNGEPEYRKYFKSTRAHNTVMIDGLDQAVQKTGFIWSRPYRAKLVKSFTKNCDLFLQASHDGYRRIKEPVHHFRSIYYIDNCIFFIKDAFLGKGIHTFELNYHIHPNSEVTSKDNRWWKINNQGKVIYIRLLNETNFDFTKGQSSPLFGWYSPSYGIKQESGVLSCTVEGIVDEVSFTTAICIHSLKEIKTLSQRLSKIEQQVENS